MSKLMLAVTLLSLSATAADAQGRRPDTRAMSCGQAAALVQARGAVVLTTGPDLYDRYVRDGGFCERDRTTQPAYVPSADTPQCFVGYRCIELIRPNDVPVPR
jgi:hypothetical protein